MAELPNAIEVELAPRHPVGLKLANPVMIASGTLGYDGYGRGLIGKHPVEELGAVIPKTVTRQPREGNPEPRWFPESYRVAWNEGDHLFLNAIGLINPGIETAVHEWTPEWARWGATVLFSFAAHSVGEFGEMAALTNEAVGISALELNLSCPNIENGAMFSYSAALTHDAVAAVKANTGLPVLAKLSPNVPDIAGIALAAVAGGADALTICNTLPAMRIDLATRRPVLGNVTGGLSGMGLRPVSLALVYQVAQALRETGQGRPHHRRRRHFRGRTRRRIHPCGRSRRTGGQREPDWPGRPVAHPRRTAPVHGGQRHRQPERNSRRSPPGAGRDALNFPPAAGRWYSEGVAPPTSFRAGVSPLPEIL